MDYTNFGVTDFVADDAFIRWVNHPDDVANQFWERFLAVHPEQTAAVTQARRMVQHLMQVQQESSDADESTVDQMWQQIEHETTTVPVRRLSVWRSYGWYAAAASLTILLGLWWFNERETARSVAELPAVMQPATANPQLAKAFKTVQGPSPVLLTDGSRIQLSANSSLRFPVRFDASQREVYLIGEAFFDVARRPDQPFLVHTNDIVTRVLGTSFRVKAYEDKGPVSVDVRTGKVAVYVRTVSERDRDASKSVTLTPNQQAVYQQNDEQLAKTISENPVPLKSGLTLDFDDAPIREVLTAVEQLYGIPIQYDRDQLANCTLTTSIDKLRLFDQLKLVCKALNATYEQKDGRVIIIGGGCD